MDADSPLSRLSDAKLLARVNTLAHDERRVTAALIASLAELDVRRLYLGAGCSSLFTYCTRVLHLSEHAAYGRIEAVRAGRRFPVLLERLQCGALTLTSVCLLAPILTNENCASVIEGAAYRAKRDVEQLVARTRPSPVVPATVRKLPTSSPVTPAPVLSAALAVGPPVGRCDAETAAGAQDRPIAVRSVHRPVVQPLAPERYKVQFTLSADGHEKLCRVRDLLRHTIANGDVGAIFSRALNVLLEEVEKNKLAETIHPRRTEAARADSRHVPGAVRRAVWKRDGGRCAFLGTAGRCTERGFLEFHHAVPHADGGLASVENIQLRCRAPNAHEAMLWSGRVEEAAVP